MDDFGDLLWFLFGVVTTIVIGALWWLLRSTVESEKQRQQRAEAKVLEQPPGESLDGSHR